MQKKVSIKNFILVLSLTIIVLYFSLKDNFYEIVKQLKNVNVFWILVGIFLMLGYYFFRSLVNRCLARKFNKHYRLKQALKMELEIAFFNAVTPFSTGGKPYEIYSLKKNKLRVVDASNVAIQNFITYQFALIILGLFSLIANSFFGILKGNSILINLVFLGFFINSLVIIFLFILSFAKKTNRFIIKKILSILSKFKKFKDVDKFEKNIENHLSEFHEGAKILLNKKLEFCLLIVLQIISLVSLYLIPMVIMFAIHDYTSISPMTSIVASAYVMLIGSFLPTPGGTGGLEYAFMVFFGPFINGASLYLLMLLWRFITYYFGMISGSILFNFGKGE